MVFTNNPITDGQVKNLQTKIGDIDTTIEPNWLIKRMNISNKDTKT